MPEFTTVLVAGKKRPYDSWTFVVVPERAMAELGSKRAAVCGTIAGAKFRGTVSRGEGVYRMPVPRELQEEAGVARGDRVRVVMELDRAPRPVRVPPELRALFDADAELARRFDALPPAHRRAWAEYVGGAKQAETRARRAAKAPRGIRDKAFPGS